MSEINQVLSPGVKTPGVNLTARSCVVWPGLAFFLTGFGCDVVADCLCHFLQGLPPTSMSR